MEALTKTIELNIYFLLLQKKKQRSTKYYKKIWEETKREIEVRNDDEPIEHRKEFMNIKFESDEDFLLSKTFNIFDMIIVAPFFLEKNDRYYSETFLH